MWTIVSVLFSSAIISLNSMRRDLLPHLNKPHTPKQQAQNEFTEIPHIKQEEKAYLVTHKSQVEKIIQEIFSVLVLNKSPLKISIESLLTDGVNKEFVITVSPTIVAKLKTKNYLVDIDNLWSEACPDALIVVEGKCDIAIAYQVIASIKDDEVVYFSHRSLTSKPSYYLKSGIDEYKWKLFYNKTPDKEPQVTTIKKIEELLFENTRETFTSEMKLIRRIVENYSDSSTSSSEVSALSSPSESPFVGDGVI
jgi:hypothetical protein